MSGPQPSIRAFKTVFTVIGALYVAMATSMVVRGPGALLDFGVAPELVAEPVLEDFFLFFYQLMAFVGVLTIVVGWVVRGRGNQAVVAAVFCVANVVWGLRDLATSDSAWGNRLYKGDATLMFVAIDAVLVVVFGGFAARGAVRKGVSPAAGCGAITSPAKPRQVQQAVGQQAQTLPRGRE